ncbi:hypothetical protein B7C51_00390 [Paenibacillus larvae subsp. pulvifaciens]|uniref:Uncharacterized protein n=1 Tax=Paenibacillus larvae subsp. pulvifaciens TaxID=1477 RepID=A0A1V0UMT9_9BACL|nr:hypothetical protein [Paenibacillus larvae]ARF66585.1 hypothetical protein B7C51_00390 [Paenibacillus larvae subsp. pulvifaciens]
MKHEYLTARKWLRLVTIPFLVLVLCLSTASVYRGAVSAAKPDQRYKPGPLYQYFVTASETYQVPLKLLLAVDYAETRWDDHGGLPSQMNSFGTCIWPIIRRIRLSCKQAACWTLPHLFFKRIRSRISLGSSCACGYRQRRTWG